MLKYITLYRLCGDCFSTWGIAVHTVVLFYSAGGVVLYIEGGMDLCFILAQLLVFPPNQPIKWNQSF